MSSSCDRIKKSLKNIFRSLLLVFISIQSVSSQSFYSVDPNYIKKRSEKKPYQSFYPDTTIEKANRFIDRNFMGNLGMPSPHYVLKFKSRSLGFRLFDVPLDDYIIKKEDVEYYRTKGPFAELSGIAGSKQLQLFRLLFSNTFKNKLNVTLRLNRYTSLGFYTKQQTFTNNFYTSNNYTTKNKRFGFTSYILVNNNRFQENGGIINDTLRQQDLLVSKDLIPVKLSGASRDNRELSAQYANWFKLNKDSSRLQSYIGLRSSFSSLKYRYKDLNSGTDNYYFLFYTDTAKTIDSTRVRTFNNELNLTFRSAKNNFNLELGYENEIAQLWQYSDTSFMNHLANVKMDHIKNFISTDSLSQKKLINTVSGSYIAAGAFAGNYKVETFHQLQFFRNKKLKGNVSLKFLSEDRTPDYIYKHWYSNHFAWDNKFNNVQMNQAELSCKVSFLTVTGIYKGITNYLYFDQLAYPMQSNNTITNGAIRINLDKVFFKHLGVSINQTWQTTSSNLISLPKSVSIASLFYKGNLFKNNLQLAVGGQVEYYDQFTPYAYMPATQAFYVQDNYKAGNFTFVDVFLNARIRPVTFFIKMENILHGVIGTNYSMVPGYYQPDRAMRFGLTWLFFD